MQKHLTIVTTIRVCKKDSIVLQCLDTQYVRQIKKLHSPSQWLISFILIRIELFRIFQLIRLLKFYVSLIFITKRTCTLKFITSCQNVTSHKSSQQYYYKCLKIRDYITMLISNNSITLYFTRNNLLPYISYQDVY